MSKLAPMHQRAGRPQKYKVDYSSLAINDVNKLKSLSVIPFIEESKIGEYYIEPVVIEYYIPKESRFAHEKKFLYIELYDPVPLNETQEKVFAWFKEKKYPIDPILVLKNFPEHKDLLFESYFLSMDMLKSASEAYQSALEDNNPTAIKSALYINEVMRKKEPKLASLKVLGDYTTYNINWCVRYLNKNNIEHSLEDKTIEYLIKLHRIKHEVEERAIDERFEILSAIYHEQAFPFDDDYFDED